MYIMHLPITGNDPYQCTAGDDMEEKIKIGIITCDRYRRCAGGKSFRSLKKGKVHLQLIQR